MNKQPNVQVWDIETGYNVANIFSLFNKNAPIPHDAIESERYIICAVFQDYHTGKVKTIHLLQDKERFKEDPTDDEYVVREIHKVLSLCDGVVAHYGDNFDMKFFNTRAIYHGLQPIPPIVQIDTYKIAKRKFLFNSNRLDYIGKYLGFGGKIKTTQQLWLDCLHGKQKAVRDMVTYCKQDVELLKQVYTKLAPYVPSTVNRMLFANKECCPSCGGTHVQKRGFQRTTTSKYQRYQCTDCGNWWRGRKAIK